jgi:hypothetical protein
MRLRNLVHLLLLALFVALRLLFEAPLWCQRNRSTHFHRDHFTVSARRIDCLLRSGTPRHERQSISRAALRMGSLKAGNK